MSIILHKRQGSVEILLSSPYFGNNTYSLCELRGLLVFLCSKEIGVAGTLFDPSLSAVMCIGVYDTHTFESCTKAGIHQRVAIVNGVTSVNASITWSFMRQEICPG